MQAIGFSIQPRGPRVDDDVLYAFRGLAVANISDVMSRTVGTNNLRPFHRKAQLLGRALTVRTRPGDNLMVHKAIDMLQTGDVIVVDAGGDCRNAIIGEIMSTLAAKRGAAGFVIDGSVRDTDFLSEGTFPVFARGAAHRGPYKDGPGEINVAVSVDGMVVHPGDIIVGDSDGVLAIAPTLARDIAKMVREIQDKEASILRQIEDGTVDRSWVDQALKSKGVQLP